MERIKRLEVGQLISPPITVSPSTPVSKIVGTLKQTNDYEVFLEGKDKIGMVTIRDILRASNITKVKAETLAFYVPKLALKSAVQKAARLMMEYRIRALPIVEDEEILGRITALSIINAMEEAGLLDFKVADLMTSRPVSLDEDDLASKARQLMIRRRIDHLPVLSKKGLEGVLTSSHIVFNMFQATETIERSTYKGVCKSVGFDVIDVPGATGTVMTDTIAKAKAVVDNLPKYDYILVHVKGTDNASHDGNAEQKVMMIEKIDALLKYLLDNVDLNNVFIAITADHTTSLDLREHMGDPVPLAIMGPGVRADPVKKYSEVDCAQGGLDRIRGVDLTPILIDLAGKSKKFGA